jgi:Arc/MetJ-type ribon-helix-helix transcriptional regulator
MVTVLETIKVPAATAAAIDTLVAAGHAASREAVIADLVTREIEDTAKRKAFDEAIEEGMASGFVEMTVDELRARLRARHAKPD